MHQILEKCAPPNKVKYMHEMEHKLFAKMQKTFFRGKELNQFSHAFVAFRDIEELKLKMFIELYIFSTKQRKCYLTVGTTGAA